MIWRTDTIGTTGGPAVRAEAPVRRATVADAALVRTMLVELATQEKTAHAVHCTVEDWQRTKVVAPWQPHDYRAYLRARAWPTRHTGPAVTREA
jgi:hypothetical protein